VAFAGLLLAALPWFRDHGSTVTAEAVVTELRVGRSQAYVHRARVEAVLPTLARPPGRPPLPEPPPAAPSVLAMLSQRALAFVMAHPGCVHRGDDRARYSDVFCLHVLEACEKHRDVALPDLATALQVPEGTLRDWLAGERPHVDPPKTLAASVGPTTSQIETVLHAWQGWTGGFLAFCDHVHTHWRVPFRRTLIAEILEAHSVRIPRRRGGRSPDESALRGQFETFFPGAQWVGDGTTLVAEINGRPFAFNVELNVDPASGAFVGTSIRPTEDAQAVVDAFEDGVATTGEPPLSLLLDNKPSNHCPEVDAALGDTLRIRATPFRPQNKAHIEGGFGLFKQTAPDLIVSADAAEGVARAVVELVVTTWARTINHRPRADRGGRSRVELYGQEPTPEQVEAARASLRERCRKQELRRQTLAARQDPVVRATLAGAFTRFGFADPDGHLLTAIARYPMAAVIDGIAIFAGKRRAGTLPDDVDARYLLGIVVRLAAETEGMAIADELWQGRLRARDQVLTALDEQREQGEEDAADVESLVAAHVDRALATDRRLDRFFWLSATADTILDQPDRRPLFRLAARRIHATRRLPHLDRLAAVRYLAAKVLPIE
jgi:hypothetical protein